MRSDLQSRVHEEIQGIPAAEYNAYLEERNPRAMNQPLLERVMSLNCLSEEIS